MYYIHLSTRVSLITNFNFIHTFDQNEDEIPTNDEERKDHNIDINSSSIGKGDMWPSKLMHIH
jgi:hypothetical protein